MIPLHSQYSPYVYCGYIAVLKVKITGVGNFCKFLYFFTPFFPFSSIIIFLLFCWQRSHKMVELVRSLEATGDSQTTKELPSES